MSGDDFLSRWSRRKLEVKREETEPSPAAETPVESGEGGEAEITPEEIAALPKIEDLTPEADITAFLRKGVPEMLKNAALRRMWSLDPAIRDYVGEAREYAYDWNVPGGVPGNGPLLPGDNVGEMLARIFGDDRPESETVGDSPTLSGSAPSGAGEADDEDRSTARSDVEAGSDDAPQQEMAAHTVDETAADSSGQAMLDSSRADDTTNGHAAPQPQLDETAVAAPRRRHGRAMPV
jgi:hypothetical protein